MRTRTVRTGYGSRGAWLRAFCALCCLVITLGTLSAADPAGSAGSEPVDQGPNQHAVSLSKPGSLSEGIPGRLSPSVAGCPVTVVPFDNSISGNGRAPNPRFAAARGHYLILASEMAAAGFTGTSDVSGIGFRFDTATGIVASAPLKIYLQNTADLSNLKSATWATAISTMTLIHNASTTIPNSTLPFDIPFSGGNFTYTGGALYVAYDWGTYTGTLSTTANVSCNSTGLANRERQANSAAVTLGALSPFGPETRLTPAVATVFNDASVDFVISLGSLAKPLVGPQTVQAIVTNKGANPLTNLPVTLNITGADTFTNGQVVPTLAACGGQTTVSFSPFTPGAIGSDTVTVSVPADDFAGNNSKNRPLDETFNLYSYKHPGTTAAGGVGNTAAIAFVAKFTTTAAAKISAVNLEFNAVTATTYRVAIYPDSGSGTPGTTALYVDAADRTVSAAGPVTITLPTPVAVGPGNFYAGVHQTNATNMAMAYDLEAPVRTGAFFLALPLPPTAWFDFAPGNNFKPNIGVTLIQCATVADCNDNNACTDDACTNQLCTHVNNNSTSCDGNPCSNPDQCLNGTCIPGPNPCNDSNACTVDLCDGQGGCIYNPVDCNDNNPCTADSCVPATGCAHSNIAGACTDGNPCTIGDACSGGACIPGSGALPAAVQVCNNAGIVINDATAPTIASPYASVITVANQASYLCSVTVNLNGITHTFPDDIDILLEHLAGPSAIIMSDDGQSAGASNVSLTLSDAAANPIPAVMVTGTYKPTNLVGGGTEAWPAPAPAPPAAPGSALSTFIGRNPNGAWNLWVVDDFADDAGTIASWCVNVVAVCTVDAACNDGNACTAGDTCAGGVCAGGPPPPCDDGNACTSNNCNPGTGLCENPPIVCNDNNTCTDDTCNTGTGCVFTNNNLNACSDNSLCTTPDVCVNGACVGQNPVVCAPDGNPCTTEACNPATGTCASTNNTNACDDANACTTGDACGPVLSENFDGVAAPNLPGIWASGVTGTGNPWTTVSTSSDTAPNSAFGFDGPLVADEVLLSPPINITSASAQLTFRNRWTFENNLGTFYDGGVLEISIGGGAFADIVTAGGSFVSGGYTGVISSSFSNPLAARNAWAGVSAGYPAYLTTVVNLPAAAAGQVIQLQWRIGTDTSASAPGQNIDTVVVQDGPTNTCQPGAPSNCDDSNPCSDDFCDSVLGCQHANNNESCEDGNACTIIDTCSGGSCAGTPIVCNDSNPCTVDSCDTGSGCVFTAITAPGETSGVAAPNKTTYTWSSVPLATQYDVVRGGTASFPVGPGGGDETCFDNLPGPSVTDATVPAPGAGFWYLSRGENACGNGTFGTEGFHGAPSSPRSTTTCP